MDDGVGAATINAAFHIFRPDTKCDCGHSRAPEDRVALNLEMTVMLQTPKEKRKMEGRDIGDLEELSTKYVMAAMNGSICPHDVKVKVLKKAGILNAGNELSPNSRVIWAACNRFLGQSDKSYRDAVAASQDAARRILEAQGASSRPVPVVPPNYG